MNSRIIRQILGLEGASDRSRRPAGHCGSLFEPLEGRSLLSTYSVTNLNDSGAGSLRQAITDSNAAAGADVVNFQAGLTGTLTLTSGQLSISDSLKINGPGASLLTVDGNGASRVFQYTGGTCTLSGLTITGGNATGDGGGVQNNGATLTLDRLVISDNSSSTTGGGVRVLAGATTITNSSITGNHAATGGGGIYLSDVVTLSNSTLSGNTAGTNGGGLTATDALTVKNTTISGNSASGSGGGIQITASGSVTAHNSTISGNSAGTSGGGINIVGTATAVSTIISGNTVGALKNDVNGIFAAGSTNNLVQDSAHSGGLTNGVNGNTVGVDPLLGALASNGGPTQTRALLSGSPAINGGTNPDSLTTDQRGTGFARVKGSAIDVGAYEFSANPLIASLSPSASTMYRGQVLTLTAGGVSDEDGTITKVSFYHDANNNGVADASELLGSDTSSSGGYVWTFTLPASYSPGNNVFLAVATDNDGGLSAAVAATVNIPNADPTLTSLTLSPSAVIIGQKVTLTANGAADSDGTIDKVDFYLDADNDGIADVGELLGSDTTSTNGYTFSYSSTSSYAAGSSVQFLAVVVDSNGALSPVRSATATFILPPPLIVTVANDINNGDFSAGDLSLREAIAIANGYPGADSITFSGGMTNKTITLGGTQLTATESVSITGPGSLHLTISGAQLSSVLQFNGPSSNQYFLSGVMVTTGVTGITNNAGTLTMSDVRVMDNTSGLRGSGITNLGTLFVTDSVISGNTVRPNASAGVAWAAGLYSTGSVTISNSSFTNNGVSGSGGGIDEVRGGGIYSSGAISLTDCVVTSNYITSGVTTASGAGIYVSDVLTLANSVISSNAINAGISKGFGAGVFQTSTRGATVTGSTISGNFVSAGLTAFGGGVYRDMSTDRMTITNSTLSSNAASAGQEGSGGGIYDAAIAVPVIISNSTIANNSATQYGGAIASWVGLVQFTNSTVSFNLAGVSGGGLIDLQDGTRVPSATSSVFSGNTVAGVANDVVGAFSSTSANNLVQDSAHAGGLTSGVQGNSVGVDPLLGLLASNGGPTQTMALLPGSPAIGAGANPGNLTTDQRGSGFARTLGTKTDIGAFEYKPQPVSSVNPLSPTTSSKTFQVSWGGTTDVDELPIASYSIYVSVNGGPYTAWLANTAATSAAYTGLWGRTYSFFSIAKDGQGLTESAPSTPDASTFVGVAGITYWDGDAADRAWANPANWSGNTLPGTGSDVVVDDPSAPAITHSAGTTLLHTFTSNAPLTITGGSLQITQDAGITGAVTISGGSLLLDHTVSIAGTLTNAGTLQLAATASLAVTGSFVQTGTGTLKLAAIGSRAGQFAHVNVSGSASLGGTLSMSFESTMPPLPVGGVMDVISAGSVSGSFDNAVFRDRFGHETGAFHLEYVDGKVEIVMGPIALMHR